MRKNFFILGLFTLIFILFVGCSTIMDISTIKDDKYIGEEVKVRGTVENSIKIGDLSGFTIVEKDGNSIAVSSDAIPAEGDEMTVKGILRKNILIGYYIEIEK